MSDEQLADYREHPDAYFGQIKPVSKKLESISDLFYWLVDVNKDKTREQLIEWLSNMPDISALNEMSKEDLLGEYCERMAGSFEAAGFGKKKTA